MLTEMLGKGGRVCQEAQEGRLRCPLIVRPTSEDAVTGNLFLVLKTVNPRWWLPDWLNLGLRTDRFRQQVFRNLRIDLWHNRPKYPRELLPWEEGSTQIDVVIRWENPKTTIYVEMKYGSDLSAKTAQSGTDFPADQLIRNVRVGLLECGYFEQMKLWTESQRDFAVLVVSPHEEQPLVEKYRNVDVLRRSVPHEELLSSLPPAPFVGNLTYEMIVELLERRRRWMSVTERKLVDQLCEYLRFKVSTVPKRSSTSWRNTAPVEIAPEDSEPTILTGV
jgi:hypothetical protein